MPKHVVIFSIICLTIISFSCVAQSKSLKLKTESSVKITLSEFNIRVDKAIKDLQTRQLSAINDTDHVNIMMCLNTILTSYRKNNSIRGFHGGRYSLLQTTANKKNYARDIVKVYPKWTPNRGMGYYFSVLKMELGGYPKPYAMFQVLE